MKKEKNVPFHAAAWAAVLAVFAPRRFASYQQVLGAKYDVPIASNPANVPLVARAFWMSLLLVASSALSGAAAGWLWFAAFAPAPAAAVSGLQVAGASLLLWGTLFVRGWEIQTWDGESLVERINRWIYRALYCLGTAVIVSSFTCA